MAFPRRQFPSWCCGGVQQFTSVEYGRLLAMVVDDKDENLRFAQQGHAKQRVCYNSPVLPLTQPNTRTLYDQPLPEEATPPLGMKHQVYSQLSHVMSSHRLDYAPISLLCDYLQDDITAKEKDDLFLSSFLVVFPVSMETHKHLIGCLCYATGPDLCTLAVCLLFDAPDDSSSNTDSFKEWSACHAPLSVRCIEVHTLPTRIRQVEATISAPCSKVHVCVRCDYHIAVFEVSSLSPLAEFLASHSRPALSCISLSGSTALIQDVKPSPFIGGEYLAVTESGGLYLGEPGSTLKTLRPPASSDELIQRLVCYGAHPRSALLVENFQVFMLDFRSRLNDLRPLLNETYKVTCMSRDPLNPFWFLMATPTELLLLDLRQPAPPLLSVRHEMPHPPRFISPLTSQAGRVSVLVSSSEGSTSLVFNYDHAKRAPPMFTIAPHSVTDISDVVESLSGAAFVATLGQVGYRMKQHLTGTAILQLDSTTLGAIVVTTLGDVFYQLWSYTAVEDSPAHSPGQGHAPSLLRGYELWVKEAMSQEQELVKHRNMCTTATLARQRGVSVNSTRRSNTTAFVNYVLSSPSNQVCKRCYSSATADNAEIQATPPGRCGLCGVALKRPRDDYDAMSALREICDFRPPKTELEVALATGWPETKEAAPE